METRSRFKTALISGSSKRAGEIHTPAKLESHATRAERLFSTFASKSTLSSITDITDYLMSPWIMNLEIMFTVVKGLI